MSVAAAEAAGAGGAAAGAEAAAGSRAAAAGAGSRGTAGPGRSRPGRSESPRSQARQAQQHARQVTRSVRSVAQPPEFHNYQGIILVEFIAAELLVAATPIATRKNKQGLSPYIPRDMTKLLAIGISYFLLELMAVAGRGPGRVGAWFGGLLLIAVGLNESANIAKTLDVFAGVTGGTKHTTAKAGANG